VLLSFENLVLLHSFNHYVSSCFPTAGLFTIIYCFSTINNAIKSTLAAISRYICVSSFLGWIEECIFLGQRESTSEISVVPVKQQFKKEASIYIPPAE
jgi:ABC-type spermidine/putrescine transport system permease subunit II